MTCIAGIVHDGKVYISGDSAGISGYESAERADKKVFVNGDFAMGFTTSFRMGQILQYAFTPVKRHPDQDVMAYMCTAFIDGVRNALKAGGFASANNNTESGGTFLVGYAGRLFSIYDDYQVGETTCGYQAVGCGETHAKGALFATVGQQPLDRLALALKAAEAHSAGVRGPFHTVTV